MLGRWAPLLQRSKLVATVNVGGLCCIWTVVWLYQARDSLLEQPMITKAELIYITNNIEFDTSKKVFDINHNVRDCSDLDRDHYRSGVYTIYPAGAQDLRCFVISGYGDGSRRIDGDSLSIHNTQAFSTKDKDNDSHSSADCAKVYKGADCI
ncbi:Hypothetical predicted protein [Mytilus galloprovincialis]|uniref:Fibrinogen C-terminal domain-containing protein n=1 Tax=Mytilus galloprovincialis TaxID=29158 RepID=A0A8B6GH91_MYTGA|nr:Hypothetical predicted protein [Mytilus galloprovincialis]